MTRPPEEGSTRPDPEGRGRRAAERERRRRRAEVFGEVLPDGTSDERAERWGDADDGAGTDEWLRGQVPPHHG